jgi:ubiquitin C-terminal hydrolase
MISFDAEYFIDYVLITIEQLPVTHAAAIQKQRFVIHMDNSHRHKSKTATRKIASKRSRFGPHVPFKDYGHIQFPETLNMTRLQDQEEESDEYRLISVASHIGSDPRDGHYIAFSLLKSHWRRFHDTYVTSVPHVPVFDANFPINTSEQTTSLLLYERTDLGTARDHDEIT